MSIWRPPGQPAWRATLRETLLLSWRPIILQEPAFVFYFALQHVLDQQVPPDKSREHVIGRLLGCWCETFSGLGVVVFVHRSPLLDVGNNHLPKDARQLRGFLVEAVALECDVVHVVR